MLIICSRFRGRDKLWWIADIAQSECMQLQLGVIFMFLSEMKLLSDLQGFKRKKIIYSEWQENIQVSLKIKNESLDASEEVRFFKETSRKRWSFCVCLLTIIRPFFTFSKRVKSETICQGTDGYDVLKESVNGRKYKNKLPLWSFFAKYFPFSLYTELCPHQVA